MKTITIEILEKDYLKIPKEARDIIVEIAGIKKIEDKDFDYYKFEEWRSLKIKCVELFYLKDKSRLALCELDNIDINEANLHVLEYESLESEAKKIYKELKKLERSIINK
jgi:hypothetical protein